jgi:hypothetical protein
VSFNDEDNETANNAAREVAIIVSSGAVKMLPGEEVSLDMKLGEERMLTFDLQMDARGVGQGV